MAIVVILVAILLGGAVVWYFGRQLYKEHRRKFEAEATEVRRLLTREINSKGLKNFDMAAFAQALGCKPTIIREASLDVYSRLWDKVLEDGEITDTEKISLRKLATALALSDADQSAVEHKQKQQRYNVAVKSLLGASVINNDNIAEMRRLRKNLGLTKADVSSTKETKAAYLAMFREIIDDSVIEPEELRRLTNFRHAFGIEENEANQVVRRDAVRLYREWFYNIVNSGEVNPNQEATLSKMAKEFDLPADIVEQHVEILKQMKRLAEIRKGNIPAIRTSKRLESGEICYADEPCRFSWETQRAIKSVEGILMITSNRIIFTSSLKSFEFRPSKIVDIDLADKATIELSVSSSRGAGTYTVDRADYVAAVLEGIVKRHNYILSESFSNAKSRHIPGDVRREVWQRDGGACVECKASEYLEYDHIIPFSKGGANTIGNVRLLCRKCNGEKSDRI